MLCDMWIIFLLINILICLVLCINCNNPIYSVLFLMLAFINLFLLLSYVGNIFVPLMILFIYIGAMSILLIFVLMLVDVKLLYIKKNFFYFNIIFIFLIAFFILYFFLKTSYFFTVVYSYSDWRITNFITALYIQSDVEAVGYYIFNFNFYPFILISIILLIALVGSISLVIFKTNSVKKQSSYDYLKNFFSFWRI